MPNDILRRGWGAFARSIQKYDPTVLPDQVFSTLATVATGAHSNSRSVTYGGYARSGERRRYRVKSAVYADRLKC